MFKFATKLSVLTMVLLGVCLFATSGSKALAATCSNGTAAPNQNWGVTTGVHSSAMAGLLVYAQDGSNTNAMSNIYYQLNSKLPPGTYDTDGHDPNERIFQYPAGSGGRDKQHWFQTGENLHNGSSDFSCDGWSVLGPGDNSSEQGNGWVIDCGETETNGTPQATQFWISDIAKPSGQQDGHWEIKVDGVENTPNLDNQAMTPFAVTNGDNRRIDLIWHYTPPHHNQPQGGDPFCTGMTVANEDTYNGHHTYTQVTISGTNNNKNEAIGFNDPARTYSYNPTSAAVTITVARYYNGGTGTNPNWIYYDDTQDATHPYGDYASWSRSFNCYSASCSPVQVTGNVPGGPSNGVIAGSPQFGVKMRITNNGPMTLTRPVLSGPGGSQSPGYLNDNDTTDVWFYPSAPSPAQNYTMTYTLNDVVSGLATCSVTVPIYQEFGVTLGGSGVTLTPTSEDPNNANYNTTINVSNGPANIKSNGEFYKLAPDGTKTTLASNNVNNPHPPPDAFSGNYTINPGTFSAGDQYCVSLHADYTHGYVGPGGPGDIVGTYGPLDFQPTCPKVVNEPYTHFLGSDVSAGGGFGDNCTTNTTGGIYTYLDTAGAQARGSGVQFGAQALGVIEGLSSASLRSTPPTGLTGLTFSNSVNISGVPPGAPELGGRFGLSSNCVPDYFSKKPATVTNTDPTSPSVAVGTNGAQYYKPPVGTALTIPAGTVGAGVNEAIYVEGDVHITGNLTYSGSRSVPADVQSLYIVVKGGNIYIDPDVTQLDGVYVAQPNGATGGKLTTCANGTSIYSVNNLYDNCKKQLKVNGAVIAQQIFLDRTYSSLRYSQGGENLFGGASHGCGTIGGDVSATGPGSAPDCAAEIFNFSPELYLSLPAGNPVSGPGTGKYDYITSLSPVL